MGPAFVLSLILAWFVLGATAALVSDARRRTGYWPWQREARLFRLTRRLALRERARRQLEVDTAALLDQLDI